MPTPSAIQLVPATPADYPAVTQLCAYYLYDLSEFTGWACPEDGQFRGCDAMFSAWASGTNYPYLLRVDGELAGFAAVGIDVATREFYLQEFFILRKFRRQGIGTAVVAKLLAQFSDAWRIDWLAANHPAGAFWPTAIERYTGEAPREETHDSPWGSMRALHFAIGVPRDFAFFPLGPLTDGELTLKSSQNIAAVPARNWLPIYDFTMQVNGETAGAINLRVGNTFSIVMYGGHIGYGVEMAFRGHHYAERACRLLLPLATAHGLTTLWITTAPDNISSRRTCERLGAWFVETVPLPEDDEQYQGRDRERCRYRLDLA